MHQNQANYDNKKFSLEGLKTQLMSLFMLKTSTSSNDDGSSFYKMIYSILTLTVIDNIMASIPLVTKFATSYISRNVAEIKILDLGETIQQKKSSVVVDINLTKSEDYFGDSVLDHITNSCNIKSILFQNKRFVLNNKDSVLVDENDQIYFKLVNETKTSDDSSVSQVIEIFSYKLDMIQLRKFVDKITTEYRYKMQNKLGGKVFYFDELSTSGSGPDNSQPKFLVFTMKEFVTNRTFDNVVGRESKAIQKRVNFFKQNKKWYDEKGIPYTLGLLLSGPPGGGKTSTIKCVANTMNRHIINVKLHDKITKSQMENLFFNDVIHVSRDGIPERFQIPTDKRIYVFEDVDCQNDENNLVLDRKEKSKDKEVSTKDPHSYNGNYDSYNDSSTYSEVPKIIPPIKTQKNKVADNNTIEDNVQEKMTLSGLLNIMDGILETPGRIIIMTSNYPERLDSALIRPGRIDLKVTFPYCDGDMITELIEKFYNVTLTEIEKNEINSKKQENLTPAEATKILFENFDDYRVAIQQLTCKLTITE
jgi:ATP-dependent 26S proteasome regulatory subunit